MLEFVNSGWHALVTNQAVMIGAGVRTSAESWELNVCVPPLSCMWQDAGEHLHETHALIWACSSQCNSRTLIPFWDHKRGKRSHSIASLSAAHRVHSVPARTEVILEKRIYPPPPVILNTGNESDLACETWNVPMWSLGGGSWSTEGALDVNRAGSLWSSQVCVFRNLQWENSCDHLLTFCAIYIRIFLISHLEQENVGAFQEA